MHYFKINKLKYKMRPIYCYLLTLPELRKQSVNDATSANYVILKTKNFEKCS